MRRLSWVALFLLVVGALYLGWSRVRDERQPSASDLGALAAANAAKAAARVAEAHALRGRAPSPGLVLAQTTPALPPTPPADPEPSPSEASTIRGLVLQRGQPVAGAKITCIGGHAEQQTQSDADGAFQFTDLAPGPVTVRALGPGGKTSRAVQLELHAGAQELRLELEPGCDLSVDVKDSAERLIPDVHIHASRFDSAEDMRRAEAMNANAAPGALYELRTSFTKPKPQPPPTVFIARAAAPQGVASLQALQPGAYEVAAVSVNFGVLHTYVELCPPSGTTKRKIRFPLGTSIEGRIVDSTGKAVAGAALHAYLDGRRGIQIPTMAKTGEDGRFVVPHVEPGRWRLEAIAPHYSKSVTELEVPVEGRRDVRLVLSAGRTIRGRVVDHQGQPAPKVWMVSFAVVLGTQKVSNAITTVPTDAEGRFELEDLDRDATYELWATAKDNNFGHPKRGAERVRVSPGVAEVELRLRPLGKVRGTVELSGGGTSPSCRVVGIEPVSCADGSFALELEPGEQVLKALAEGYATAQVPVQVEEGSEVRVAIRLEPSRKLTVTVVDARTQRPLPGVDVHWSARLGADGLDSSRRSMDDMMEQAMNMRVKNLTDAEGRSTKSAASDVGYWVTVNAPDYASKTGELGGRLGDELVLALEGVMTVSGDIVLPAELEGSSISSGLGQEGGHNLQGLRDLHFSHPVATSAVGHYRLLVRVELSEHLAVMISQPIEVPAGGLRDLRLVVPVGQASASFDLRGAEGPGRLNLRPSFTLRSLDRPELSYESSYDPRGPLQFRQGLLVPGNYTLSVARWTQPATEQKVVLVAGQEAQIKLEK